MQLALQGPDLTMWRSVSFMDIKSELTSESRSLSYWSTASFIYCTEEESSNEHFGLNCHQEQNEEKKNTTGQKEFHNSYNI